MGRIISSFPGLLLIIIWVVKYLNKIPDVIYDKDGFPTKIIQKRDLIYYSNNKIINTSLILHYYNILDISNQTILSYDLIEDQFKLQDQFQEEDIIMGYKTKSGPSDRILARSYLYDFIDYYGHKN